MTFATPIFLLLLLFIIPWILSYWFYLRKNQTSMKVSKIPESLFGVKTIRTRLKHLPFILRIIVFVLLVIVLARPQTHSTTSKSDVEGIDIIMSMDISTSMLTPDVDPNRLEAAKSVAQEFIINRANDNIGLVLFGGEAFLQCPLTMNHHVLLSMLKKVSCDLQANGQINSGTAIGMGLANSVAHLENSKAKSKVVILLTDGVNNTGDISPEIAAEVAKECSVKVYTISLGSQGHSLQTITTLPNGENYEANIENAVNTDVLQNIASITGGKFFKAVNRESLNLVYAEIDRLEKTKLNVSKFHKKEECYPYFALVAFILFLSEIILRLTWLRKLP